MFYSSPYSTSVYDSYVAVLEAVVTVAVGLSVLISVDRLFHVAKYVRLKLKARLLGIRPETAFRFVPFPDAWREPERFPKVAVQLPMFNERAVCQAIIDHSCSLTWPKEKLTIQV